MFQNWYTSHRKNINWSMTPDRSVRCISRTSILIVLAIFINVNSSARAELWPTERPEGMPVIQSLEVMCGKDHMDVHLAFSQPFEGIVSSKGQHGDPRCIYVPPSSGQTFFSFRIAYSRCGTKPDLHGQFYENTVVVQYDKDLLEVWDEAKRLRCEWFNDYEKTASKPPMVIADLDVVQLDFRGDNVDCWMEIQAGKGPWAPPVSGIVPLGSTLTLVVAINDFRGEFDMRVKSCAASDGGGHVIQLSDEYGCVLRPKMISRFLKVKGADERATVITYAFFHAFKFPDALSVHIRCKVEICRHGCLDHCQLAGVSPGQQQQQYLERKEDIDQNDISADPSLDAEDTELPESLQNASLMEDDNDQIVSPQPQKFASQTPRSVPQTPKSGPVSQTPRPLSQPPRPVSQLPPRIVSHAPPVRREPAPVVELDAEGSNVVEQLVEALARPFSERLTNAPEREIFPQGPRNLGEDIPKPNETIEPANKVSPAVAGPRSLRRKRASRDARSTDVGVSGIYEVVSQNDLAFGPEKAASVTVFSGRIPEEVVYGICMPALGFGALFASLSGAAIGAAMAAGVMLQKLRTRRALCESQMSQSHSVAAWMALRILGTQQGTCEG